MKRYRRILILLGVLAVACAATFAVSRYEEYKEEIANSDEVILEIPTDSVTTLSWTIGDGNVYLVSTDRSEERRVGYDW